MKLTRTKKDLTKSNLIVYIGDNSGEIVFDRVFLEHIKDVWPDKKIYFLFRAKCSVIAKHLGCKLGDIVLKYTYGC